MTSEEEKNRIQRILDRVPGSIMVDVLDHLRTQQFRTQPEPIEGPVNEEKVDMPPESTEPTISEKPQKDTSADKTKLNGNSYTSSGKKESRYPGAEEWNDLKDIFG